VQLDRDHAIVIIPVDGAHFELIGERAFESERSVRFLESEYDPVPFAWHVIDQIITYLVVEIPDVEFRLV